jgi:hypothetical protein
MTTKDYVYLGLILLAALAFYCNGFYAGVYRCKRMYDSLLDDTDAVPAPESPKFSSVKLVGEEEKVLAGNSATRDIKVRLPNSELKGDFGKN